MILIFFDHTTLISKSQAFFRLRKGFLIIVTCQSAATEKFAGDNLQTVYHL